MMKHVCRQRFSNQHSLGYRHRQTTAVQQWELAFLYVWKTHLYKCLALPVVQHSCVSCGIQYGLKQQGWVRSFKFCFGLYKGQLECQDEALLCVVCTWLCLNCCSVSLLISRMCSCVCLYKLANVIVLSTQVHPLANSFNKYPCFANLLTCTISIR